VTAIADTVSHAIVVLEPTALPLVLQGVPRGPRGDYQISVP
jgi:hypothetical protein